ncbi:cucumber peeling cupredoxin [Eucalyptus grandis]|uniref:cucumber peeling cupredoxin n=1 Tax=Eucalyptus grandis TaxID=71139 RepID=UPI00192EFB10|nr:cucumber peeling cupredoxin [Eucalyptus grandis]
MVSKMNMLVLMVFLGAAIRGCSAQTSHAVGDSLGWTIPPGGSIAYSTWASNKTFVVGDTLVFTFTTGAHDVAEVTKAAYDGCNSTSPISFQTTGPASIRLNHSGEHFYICTFNGHCGLGQKLAINVTASSAATPSPSPAPTPSSPSPAPTPSSTSPAPTPSSTSPAPTPTSPAATPSSPPPAPTPTSPAANPSSPPSASTPPSTSPPSPPTTTPPSPTGSPPSSAARELGHLFERRWLVFGDFVDRRSVVVLD